MNKLEELLKQVEEASAAATPGPWTIFNAFVDGETYSALHVDVDKAATSNDVRFIALSRTAMPRLAEALRVAVEALERITEKAEFEMPGINPKELPLWIAERRREYDKALAREALEKIDKVD